jgi:signal transduction histidine kinase
MSSDTLTQLFNPFYTTKSVGQGTGLGLSISYSIMQSHKGDIKVESSLGEGTTFTVILPLANKAL